MQTRILIAAGGTGGHIFPAIALAETLKSVRNDIEILFVSSDSARDTNLFDMQGAVGKVQVLPVRSLNRVFSLQVFNFLIGLVKGAIKSCLILRRFKPNVVVGFGSYIAGPIVAISYFKKIPTIIHEQNLIPGKANRILARFVDKIAISFEETEEFFLSGTQRNKIVFTGNPIRPKLIQSPKQKARRLLGLDEDKLTLLIMGGSQGSNALNEAMLQVISLMAQESRDYLQVVHLCGDVDEEWVMAEYKRLGIPNATFAFSNKMDVLYSAADIIVARAGAMTLSEIAYFGLPSILIPYPYSTYHQYANADFFRRSGAALLLEQNNQLVDNLRFSISRLIHGKSELSAMSNAARRLSISNAAMRLAEEVLKFDNER